MGEQVAAGFLKKTKLFEMAGWNRGRNDITNSARDCRMVRKVMIYTKRDISLGL